MYNKLRMALLNIGFKEIIGSNRFESEVCTVELDKLTCMIYRITRADGKEVFTPISIYELESMMDAWEEGYDI